MNSYEERIARAKATLKQTDFPEQVVVESTSICNFICPGCPSPTLKRKRGYIQLATFKKIVDEIAAENPNTQLWFAFMGEALLWKDLFTLIRYAKDKGLKDTRLNTNGSLLDAKRIQQLHDSGIDRVIISIDGHSTETFEAIRLGGNYTEVRENTLNLLAAAKAGHWKNPEIWVQIVVMDENEHEEVAFKEFWMANGAIVKIRPKLAWGERVKAENLHRVNIPRDFPCPWLMRQMIITDQGDFAMCGADHEAKWATGNIANLTIKQAWNAELRKRRDLHLAGDFSFALCRRCQDWKVGMSDVLKTEKEKTDE